MKSIPRNSLRWRLAAKIVVALAVAGGALFPVAYGADSPEVPPASPAGAHAENGTLPEPIGIASSSSAEPMENGGGAGSPCPHGECAKGCHACPLLNWFFPPNMPPHMPYCPELHGYYYFWPYNYSHIGLHRRIVMSWGGDPRNPYANGVFERVYAATVAQPLPAPQANSKTGPKAPTAPLPPLPPPNFTEELPVPR